jgi:hypothetical protein
MVSFAISRSTRLWHLYTSRRSISSRNRWEEVINDLFSILYDHKFNFSQPTNNIYTENLREAAASNTYILHGDPVFEIYEPTYETFLVFVFISVGIFFSFTYHGFRYLSVLGSPNPLALDDVECPFVHSETTLRGNFTSSNPIINQIQHNVQWGQLSNSMSLPTDW